MRRLITGRGLRLLLAAGICLGTLASVGAAGGADGALPQPAEALKTEERVVEPAEAAARTRRAAELLARRGVNKQQRDALSVRMGQDEFLFSMLERGELTRVYLTYLALPNGRAGLLDRYSIWAVANPELTAEEAVLQVNMNRDRDFYACVQEVEEPSGLAVLVNKHYALPAEYVPELEALGKGYGTGSLRPEAAEAKAPFGAVLKKVLADPVARRFTVFVFVSMLAYSAQELILEPYAGLVFGLGPGATTKLAGLQHGGVLAGMLLVAGVTLMAKGTALASLRLWTAVGCAASALALFAIAAGGPSGLDFPLRGAVFALGLANGIYAVAAIGSMMALAGRGGERERGTRMGVWGAAQGVAFGGGGVLGAFAVDAMRLVVGDPVQAYATVFVAEGVLFLVAVAFALRTESAPASYPLDPALEAR